MKKLHLIILIGITTFIYFHSFNNDFVSLDDNSQVVKNPLVKNLSFENVNW